MKEILDVRKDFPVLQNNPDLVYLDTAATSLKPQCVLDKINEYYTQYGVNVNRGVYSLSYHATEEYEETRAICARFLNAKEEEIVFTKGASNGLNMLAMMLGESLTENDNIVTSELEHHSNFLPWQNQCKKHNASIRFVPLTSTGRITVESFEKTIDKNTKFVVINHVSNVMGYLSPIEDIIRIAHSYGAKVVLDAAQSVPHMKIDVKALDVDFLAFSTHKMMGPTGFGILYGKYKYLKDLKPIEWGGDMIDEVYKDHSTYKDVPFRFETGTPAIAEAIAFKEAIRYIEKIGYDNIHNHVKALYDYTIEKLQGIENLEIYNENSETGIIAFNVKNVHPHDASTIFDQNNVALRAGHHCAQLIIKWLEVVGTLRATIYIYNTYEDMDKFVASVKEACDYFKDW